MTIPVLSVRNLEVEFLTRRSTLRAINGVSFDIAKGEGAKCVLGGGPATKEDGGGKYFVIASSSFGVATTTQFIVQDGGRVDCEVGPHGLNKLGMRHSKC